MNDDNDNGDDDIRTGIDKVSNCMHCGPILCLLGGQAMPKKARKVTKQYGGRS